MCYAVPYPLPFPRTILKRLPAFSIDVLLSPRRGTRAKLYFNKKTLTKDRSDYAVPITEEKLHVLLMLKMARLGVLDLF